MPLRVIVGQRRDDLFPLHLIVLLQEVNSSRELESVGLQGLNQALVYTGDVNLFYENVLVYHEEQQLKYEI
jgi:hypothetical protein